jgi:hypothetical protein
MGVYVPHQSKWRRAVAAAGAVTHQEVTLMSGKQPSGDQSAEFPERQEPEQIAVLMTQEQAYCASVALVDEVQKQIETLAFDGVNDLDEVHCNRIRSIDAQSNGRSLMRALNALEAIGWPHAHMREEFMHNLTEREASGVGPWSER